MKLAQEARVIAFALFPACRELVLRLSVKSEEWKIGGCHGGEVMGGEPLAMILPLPNGYGKDRSFSSTTSLTHAVTLRSRSAAAA